MNFFFLVIAGAAAYFVMGPSLSEDAMTDVFYKYDALFKKYGTAYGVDWHWLKAIAMNESSLGSSASVAAGIANPYDVDGSVSDDGKSWGLMQLTLPTASDFQPGVTAVDLNNPETSIRIAAKFLKFLQTRFSVVDTRFTEWVIKSYNQGAGTTAKEISGESDGFAAEYWDRFKRNLIKVEKGENQNG